MSSRARPHAVRALAVAIAIAGCDQSGTTLLPPPSTGTLHVEIIDSADVSLQPLAAGALGVSVTFQGNYGLFDGSAPITGNGRIDAYPEVGMVAYTAKLSAPPLASGGCGAAPVSLALSLARRGANTHVGGGVAVYCGKDTYSGNPQRILRVQGDLPLLGAGPT